MHRSPSIVARVLVSLAWLVMLGGVVRGQPVEPEYCIFPEQRNFEFRQEAQLRPAAAPQLGQPKTVDDIDDDFEEYYLSLDEAIQIALANADVIRVLTGTTATSTGQTIYDPAITNTDIDAARATFDPVFETDHTYRRLEDLSNIRTDILDPDTEVIIGSDLEQYELNSSITQTKAHGGTARVGVNVTPTGRNVPGTLINPQTPSSVELSYTQPLLRGRGSRVNLAPIVIARINTERSFYALKDAVQELVRSVVDGYWSLVQARVDIWARKQQIKQLEYAYTRLEAQRRVQLADRGDTAQAKVSLEQFRANLIAQEAQLLDLEAALLNALGLPPVPDMRIIPVTPPQRDMTDIDWDQLIATASQQRPDIIERKLAIEAIEQQLIINSNATLPQLDAIALTRLKGLSADTPLGVISSDPFQATDVQIGLDLRAPLGQRAARAALRQQQMSLARERSNLYQQLHQATHDLAFSWRNLNQFYKQYEAFKLVREASRINLDRRFQVVRVGGLRDEPLLFVDVLLSITDWGNAVSSEALSLTRYNAELANLETQAGVILMRHGIVFQEEQYASMGPLKDRWRCELYPQSAPPGSNSPRYEVGDEPSEDTFDLEDPIPESQRPKARYERRPPREEDLGDEPSEDGDVPVDEPNPSVWDRLKDVLPEPAEPPPNKRPGPERGEPAAAPANGPRSALQPISYQSDTAPPRRRPSVMRAVRRLQGLPTPSQD